jgi:hypothetical protein
MNGKNKINRKKLLKQEAIFCTECGVELQNFCFSLGADNVEAIKMNLAQCKKSGKFTGEFCSKLFISGEENLDSMFEDEEQL